MVELEHLWSERTYAHELLIDIIHIAFGVRDGTARYEQTAVVGGGHDLEIGGVDNFDRIGEIGHKVRHIHTVGRQFVRYALDDIFLGEQRFVAVDHHVQIGGNFCRDFI